MDERLWADVFAAVIFWLIVLGVVVQFAAYTILGTARTLRGYWRDYTLDRDIGAWRASPPGVTPLSARRVPVSEDPS